MTFRRSEIWLSLLLVVSAGCEDAPRAAPVADASSPPPPAPPPREGCARVGPLEAALGDPTCVVRHVGEDAMRVAMKHLSITASAEPPEVIAGATSLVTVTIRNTATVETTVFFEAKPRVPGPRTDWSRVAGIPEPLGSSPEAPRLFFPMTTLDAWEHDVDAFPTIANSADKTPAPPTVLAVHLRPGGKLTQNASWWAYRIPAPAPIVKDDAGHRYVPKTAATHLLPGEYTIVVDPPLYGLGKEERKLTTRVRVIRAPHLDGAARP